MQFASDNWAGVCPQVAAALSRLEAASAPAYGRDGLSAAMNEALSALFEKPVSTLVVATGSAANALALAAFAKPGGLILAQRNAHILTEEYGGPERVNSGQRIVGLKGENSKLTLHDLEAAQQRFLQGSSHHGRLTGVSLTQATELGQVYTCAEVKKLTHKAKAMNIGIHMDGARLANAVAHLGCSPAEITWKAGVDLLSLGFTKNGAWCADLLVCFSQDMAFELNIVRKQMGHALSKPRFVAAQILAMLEQNLWLKNAKHANRMAAYLADALIDSGKATVPLAPQANEVFGYFAPADVDRLQQAGGQFYPWTDEDAPLSQKQLGKAFLRFVTSFATQKKDIEALRKALD